MHKSDSNANVSQKEIVSILPIADNQKSLWFHCKRSRFINSDVFGSSGQSGNISEIREYRDPGLIHVQFSIGGCDNDDLLREAWGRTVLKYEALRTTVHSDDKHEALLVVHRDVPLQFDLLDCSSSSVEQIGDQIELYKQADIANGFPLEKFPTYRIKGFRTGPNSCKFVWTCHHLLLDGWSGIVVVKTFLAYCNAQPRAEPAVYEDILSYTEYRQKLVSSEDESHFNYWRKRLFDFHQPTLLRNPLNQINELEIRSHTHSLLDASGVKIARKFCSQVGVTPATLAQSVWALLLSQMCNTDDVAFGLTVSGRPSFISGIDNVVGNLANMVPMRVSVEHDDTVANWLRKIQVHQFESQAHAHLAFEKLIDCAEPGCRQSLFDSLLIFQNLPTLHKSENSLSVDNKTILCTDYTSAIVSALPLVLTVLPYEEWNLQIDFESSSFTIDWVKKISREFAFTLGVVIESPDNTLNKILQTRLLRTLDHPDPTALNYKSLIATDSVLLLQNLVPPKNNNELRMVALWEDLLQTRPLSADVDFFQTGGTSLGALKLIEGIELEFGVKIPIVRFLQQPTPIGLVELISSTDGRTDAVPSLVPLNAEGYKPALFCLHAGAGHAMFYRDFARRLDNDRPVYGLQPKGIDGLDKPFTTVEEMASHYLSEIIAIQPEGPYHMMGNCFGGALLIEMAYQLQREGRTIGHLIAADAASPVPATHPFARFNYRAYVSYEIIRHKTVPQLFRGIWKRVKKIQDRLFKPNRGSSSLPGWVKVQSTQSGYELGAMGTVQRSCVEAFKRYRAPSTDLTIEVLSVVTDQGDYVREIELANWQRIATAAPRTALRTHHRELFVEPHVAELSDVVRSLLETNSLNQSVSKHHTS